MYVFLNNCISSFCPRLTDLHYSLVSLMLLAACFAEHQFTKLNQQNARWIVHFVVWVMWTGEFCVHNSCGLYRNNVDSVAFHYICISVNLISSHYTFLSRHSLFLLQLHRISMRLCEFDVFFPYCVECWGHVCLGHILCNRRWGNNGQ